MKKRVTASLFAAIMAASLLIGVTPVHAAYSTTLTGTTKMQVNSYLVMNEGAKTPNITVTYQISAGTPQSAATSGETEILAGYNPSAVKWNGASSGSLTGTATFTPTDTVYTSKNGSDGVTLEANQQYAKKTLTLDFANCKFDQPGIYRYNIKQSSTAPAGVTLETSTYAIDVYVQNVDQKGTSLTIGKCIILNSATTKAPSMNGTTTPTYTGKVDGFTNYYTTADLSFKNRVVGSLASRDKYFKYHLSITGVSAGSTFQVVATDTNPTKTTATTYDTSTMKTANSRTTLTATGGSISTDFYLKHSDVITIKDLPKDASYAVTVTPEEYKQESDKITNFGDATSGKITSTTKTAVSVTGTSVNTSYILSKGSVPQDKNNDDEKINVILPTGVVMNVAPFAAAVLLGGIGAMMFARRKKEADEEV